MLETPRIIQTTPQATAVIHLIVPREEIQAVMHPGLGELMAAVAAQGMAPAGPWFTHHFKVPDATFDFEIGVPVASPVVAAGRMKPGQLPGTVVARTVYRGGYEGLAAAWGEFVAWIAANGYTPGTDLWECYVLGPEANSDPAAWRTELNRPLVAGPHPALGA